MSVVNSVGRAAAGTAFASGQIDVRDMMKVGLVATVVMIVIIGAVHLLFAPIL